MNHVVILVIICKAGLALPAGESVPDQIQRENLEIPNVAMRDQDNQNIHFYDDLIKDRVVAMNFIFTSCPTICPPMGANFGALQGILKERGLDDVSLISVSIDPRTDTPARLKQWRDRFKGKDGWSLVTGPKGDVDKLLKLLKVFSADISAHAPFVIIGNDRTGAWQYVNGLTPPEKLTDLLKDLEKGDAASEQPEHKPATEKQSAAAGYFGDIRLTDQNGRSLRLYSDLMEGKTVIINSFFSSCQGVCPVTMGAMVKIQDWLGERLGRDVHILSLTVDPVTDTPDQLKTYAASLKARPGWFLLTGERQKLNQALHKFGHYVEQKESHQNIFIIGNDRTGLWKKALGLAPPEEIIEVVRGVVEDRG